MSLELGYSLQVEQKIVQERIGNSTSSHHIYFLWVEYWRSRHFLQVECWHSGTRKAQLVVAEVEAVEHPELKLQGVVVAWRLVNRA